MKEVNEVKEEMNVEAASTEDEGGEAKDSQQDEEAVSPTPETQENKT